MKLHEADLTALTNFKPPVGAESFHQGTFVDSPKPFQVLLLSGAEVKAIRDTHIIPITEITDAENQLDARGLASAKPDEIDPELPKAWVQDSPIAREALSQFTEKKPRYDVHRDLIADALF